MSGSEMLLRIAFASAAVAALYLASHLPIHRRVAIPISVAALVDAAAAFVPREPDSMATLAHRAAFLALPLISMTTTWAVLAAPRPSAQRLRVGVLVSLLAWASLVFVAAHMPPTRGAPAMVELAQATKLVAIASQLAITIPYVARIWRRHAVPTCTEVVVLLLVVGDIGEWAGPWAAMPAWQSWDLARWQWALVYSVIAGIQARRILWLRRSALRAARQGRGSSPSVPHSRLLLS